jgi:hypothetical protein
MMRKRGWGVGSEEPTLRKRGRGALKFSVYWLNEEHSQEWLCYMGMGCC